MIKTCGNCLHYGRRASASTPNRYAFGRCSLTNMKVCGLTKGCVLHLSDQDLAKRQQEQNESWRPRASVPLAVP